jgi:predicted transcriptional regulator
VLKGSKLAIVRKIQPVSIHGQVSLDVYYTDPDDEQGQVRIARVGEESVPRGLEPGDTVELHYVVGVVTHITKTS